MPMDWVTWVSVEHQNIRDKNLMVNVRVKLSDRNIEFNSLISPKFP